MAAPLPRPDYWTRWFFRVVQLVGVGLGVHESLGEGRPFVLLFSGALILGAVGLRAMLRGAAAIVETSATEAREESDGKLG